MYSKMLIYVQRLCQIEIIPDYTGVGLACRFHCTIKVRYNWSKIDRGLYISYYIWRFNELVRLR